MEAAIPAIALALGFIGAMLTEFVRDGAAWSEQAFLKASNTGFNDWFGSRLALSGDGHTAAVGASLEDGGARGIDGRQNDDSALDAGAVYLFRRSGSTWRQHAYIKGANTEAYDEFGSSVALDRAGTLLVATALGEDSSGTGGDLTPPDDSIDAAGAAYVFDVH